jgi:hypothetical protein
MMPSSGNMAIGINDVTASGIKPSTQNSDMTVNT